MKRSVNLGGNRWNGPSEQAKNLLATFRALGMSDEEIRVELQKILAKRDGEQTEKESVAE